MDETRGQPNWAKVQAWPSPRAGKFGESCDLDHKLKESDYQHLSSYGVPTTLPTYCTIQHMPSLLMALFANSSPIELIRYSFWLYCPRLLIFSGLIGKQILDICEQVPFGGHQCYSSKLWA